MRSPCPGCRSERQPKEGQPTPFTPRCHAPGQATAAPAAVRVRCLSGAGVRSGRDGRYLGQGQVCGRHSAVLPGGIVTSVSCASSGNCSAGGYYGTGSTQAFIVNETHGTWGKAEAVPGLAALNRGNAEVSSVSCTAVGDCTAGGEYDSSNGFQAFVVDEKDGTWGAAHPVPHVAGLASTGYGAEVSRCPAPLLGNCTAGGWARQFASVQALRRGRDGRHLGQRYGGARLGRAQCRSRRHGQLGVVHRGGRLHRRRLLRGGPRWPLHRGPASVRRGRDRRHLGRRTRSTRHCRPQRR